MNEVYLVIGIEKVYGEHTVIAVCHSEARAIGVACEDDVRKEYNYISVEKRTVI